jgi:hypothetical protein
MSTQTIELEGFEIEQASALYCEKAESPENPRREVADCVGRFEERQRG